MVKTTPAVYPGFSKALLIAALAGLLCPSGSGAAVLDWNNLTWTSGALSETFYATNSANASTATSKGIYYADDLYSGLGSVTISISGDTSRFNGGYPKINNNTTTGGLSPAQDALQLQINFNANTENITVSVVFNNYSAGVQSLNYSLFSIDAANNSSYVDQVRAISAQLTNGSLVGATITGSANNQVSGSGTNQTLTGVAATANNSGSGNATIDFGIDFVNRADFTFGDDSSAAHPNPPAQTFALYNINFKPKAPEVGPGIAAILVCALTAIPRVRRWLGPRR
jgi:hypothetical protein